MAVWEAAVRPVETTEEAALLAWDGLLESDGTCHRCHAKAPIPSRAVELRAGTNHRRRGRRRRRRGLVAGRALAG